MRILHFIDSLNYGGAETLLMSYLPLLSDDEHIVVTLRGPNVYKRANYEYVELDAKPPMGIFRAAMSIRKLIAEKHIDILHSHSFWTNIISRFAAGKKTKLINHYHFADYDTMKDKPGVKKMIFLDKVTNRKTLIRVAVSEYLATVLKNTFPTANIKLLPNFIECRPDWAKQEPANDEELKVVAVGSCNVEKNYPLVLQAFEALKQEPIRIDIMGGGDRLEFYRNEVKRMGLTKVRFCGIVPNIREHLWNYDLFLSTSISETFGIAVLEGVCARLPLVISNIPAFNEIAPRGSLFFDPNNKDDLVRNLRNFLNSPYNPDTVDYDRILRKYSAQIYLSQLRNLYYH